MLSATMSGRSQAFQIEHQAQIQTQIGGIDHAHQKIRRRLARVPPEHHIARDGLIEARRLEAVGAGQIEHAIDAAGAGADEAAFFSLDGDARIVRNFLAAAGQAIEEGCFTAVRDADQRKARSLSPRPRRSLRLTRMRKLDPNGFDFATSQSKGRRADAHDKGITARPAPR